MTAGLAEDLKPRVLTGVLGGFSLLGLILYGREWGFFLFVIVISLGMVAEYGAIVFTLSDRAIKKAVLLISGLLIFIGEFGTLHFTRYPIHQDTHWITHHDIQQDTDGGLLESFGMASFGSIELGMIAVLFLGLCVYFLLSARKHRGEQFNTHFTELVFSIFGLVYLVFLPLFFLKLYRFPQGEIWVILFLSIVFAGDTGSYFSGRFFGKHKLYLEMSPKKTWEGAVGGLLAGLGVAVGFKMWVLSALPWVGVVVIPLVVGITAQTGDLCESYFKRVFQKKDSGSILPGHGGFLDRFDGVVFSLPVMYACVWVFG